MRLVKSSGDRREPVGPETVRQLRDIGGRIEHVIAIYGRMLRGAGDETAIPSELRDGVESINGQLAYLTRRLQELIIAEYEERRAGVTGQRVEPPQRVAVG